MIEPALLTTTLQVFRPFGASSPLVSNVPCRMTTDFPCGRGSGLAGVAMWTHYADVQPGTDIADGCTRSFGADSLLYADGDEVRSPSGHPSPKYVVVWVEERNQGTADNFLRAYLLRDTA